MSTQPPEQAVSPDGHIATQPVGPQNWSTGQATLQPPQWRGSLLVSTQDPRHGVKVGEQSNPHFPAMLLAMPFATAGQIVPHAPQFSGSESSARQVVAHGFSGSTQTNAQRFPEQIGSPPTGAVHSAPHPPQFCSSSAKTTQFPAHRVWPSAHTSGASLWLASLPESPVAPLPPSTSVPARTQRFVPRSHS